MDRRIELRDEVADDTLGAVTARPGPARLDAAAHRGVASALRQRGPGTGGHDRAARRGPGSAAVGWLQLTGATRTRPEPARRGLLWHVELPYQAPAGQGGRKCLRVVAIAEADNHLG